MAKKTKKSSEFEHKQAPMLGVYSNTVGIGYSDTEVVLNFGLSTPSYLEPHEDEDIPVARIVLSWEGAKELLESLGGIAAEKSKKPQKRKQKAKSKS